MTRSVRALQWYRIMGHPMSPAPFHTLVCFVEATFPSHVMKHYGGRRLYRNDDGEWLMLFPSQLGDVHQMKSGFAPPSEDEVRPEGIVIEVIQAARYQCVCGKIHVSDYPYPSMWCKCGQKALPVSKFVSHIQPR